MEYNHTRTTDIKKSLAVVRKTMYVAGEMKRQDPTEVKDNLAMTAKPVDTNRCSNGKKLIL